MQGQTQAPPLSIETSKTAMDNSFRPLVVGYPRTGFSLLISVLAEIGKLGPLAKAVSDRAPLLRFCDDAGTYIATQIERVCSEYGVRDDLIYNPNFRQLVGGPKWLKEGDPGTACFRKYIGIRGLGDFTLITSHPRAVLEYYDIAHFHVSPSMWEAVTGYCDRPRYASIRHPAGTICSACFSINALASEYIQRFVPPTEDNDSIRQRLAMYKLSDLNFFDALIGPFVKYLEEFVSCSARYQVMRWEDLILEPVRTLHAIASSIGVSLTSAQAQEIWRRLDHVNLTGAHKHNLRQGHGVVGGWRRWLTNTHLDLMRERGLEDLSKRLGYGPFPELNELEYTPFQKELADWIGRGRVFRDFPDMDLFQFAFNKSNIDIDRFDFKRFPWREHTRIERSSLRDDELLQAVSDAAEAACSKVNKSLLELQPDGTYPGFGPEPGRAQPSAPVLRRTAGNNNIVEFAGMFYSLPQSLGPVDFYSVEVQTLPGVCVAESLAAILKQIEQP